MAGITCRRAHIADSSVGATAYHNLVHRYFPYVVFAEETYVGRQVREGHGRSEGREVQHNFLFVFRVLVRRNTVAVGNLDSAGTQIIFRRVVHREKRILCAAFHRHIAYRQPVFDGKGSRVPEKFEGFVSRAVNAKHTYESEHDVFPRDVAGERASQGHPYCGGHLEPQFAAHHSRRHIRGPHARGEAPECTVCAGVTVRADDESGGTDYTQFGQQGVFYSVFTCVVETAYTPFAGEIAHDFALFGGFDVFCGHEMVEHQHHSVGVFHRAADAAEFADCHGCSYVVAEHNVHVRGHEFARPHEIAARMAGEYFLGCSHFRCHNRLRNQTMPPCPVSLYSKLSASADQLASTISVETPTVVQDFFLSDEVISTRTIAPVAPELSTTRTL